MNKPVVEVDVEGFEECVFKGMSLPKDVSHIFVEVTSRTGSAYRFLRLLV